LSFWAGEVGQFDRIFLLERSDNPQKMLDYLYPSGNSNTISATTSVGYPHHQYPYMCPYPSDLKISYHILKIGCLYGFGAEIICTIYIPTNTRRKALDPTWRFLSWPHWPLSGPWCARGIRGSTATSSYTPHKIT
jgi:hypothetical protein